jgi:hypothetical protein
MSWLHVRQIGAAIEKRYSNLVNISDYIKGSEKEQKDVLLSRGLAAYALTQSAEIDDEIASRHVVDGSDDNGIDAIYFDQTDHILYVVQSKWIHSGNGSLDRGDIQKFIKGFGDLIEPDFSRFNDKVVGIKEEILKALDDAQTKFKLIIAYTGQQPLSKEADRDLNDLLNELNDPTELVSYQAINQKALHAAVSGQAYGDPIELEIMLSEWGQTRDPFTAFYGQISAEDIASWWNEYDNRLFANNLRKFMKDTEVNESIKETLLECPEKFFYFNNGIIILCRNIAKKPIGGPDRKNGYFICKDVSVVNGAQTVGSIGATYATNPEAVKRAQVLVRLISLEGCPEGLDTEITRATNTQNRIEPRDFASLDPEQQRLKTEMLLLHSKEYIFKSGEETPLQENGCDIVEATIALACLNNDPGLAVQAKREIRKLWDNIERNPYKMLFNPSLTGIRLWRAVEVKRVVDCKLDGEKSKRDGRERLICVHGNRLILHQVFRRLPVDKFDDLDYEFERVKELASEETISVLNDLITAVNQKYPNSYPANIFKNKSKCIEISDYLGQKYVAE